MTLRLRQLKEDNKLDEHPVVDVFEEYDNVPEGQAAILWTISFEYYYPSTHYQGRHRQPSGPDSELSSDDVSHLGDITHTARRTFLWRTKS